MIFDPDLTKNVQQVIISKEVKKLLPSALLFNNISFKNCMFHKHFHLTLNIKLNILENIKVGCPELRGARRETSLGKNTKVGFRIS